MFVSTCVKGSYCVFFIICCFIRVVSLEDLIDSSVDVTFPGVELTHDHPSIAMYIDSGHADHNRLLFPYSCSCLFALPIVLFIALLCVKSLIGRLE